jgi:RimJ/RimL family protein N-acetyltransferase
MSVTPPRALRDVRIRPIRPDDWRRLQRFHDRLSSLTVERRFHGAKRHLSEPLAHRFTQLDGCDQVGLVATTGSWGRIVGVARYARVSASSAEVAFVIEDAYQHHGLGRRLMQRLAATARENGITEFVAEVLPGNAPMFNLLDHVGRSATRFAGGQCEVHVQLAMDRESGPRS